MDNYQEFNDLVKHMSPQDRKQLFNDINDATMAINGAEVIIAKYDKTIDMKSFTATGTIWSDLYHYKKIIQQFI